MRSAAWRRRHVLSVLLLRAMVFSDEKVKAVVSMLLPFASLNALLLL